MPLFLRRTSLRVFLWKLTWVGPVVSVVPVSSPVVAEEEHSDAPGQDFDEDLVCAHCSGLIRGCAVTWNHQAVHCGCRTQLMESQQQNLFADQAPPLGMCAVSQVCWFRLPRSFVASSVFTETDSCFGCAG